MKARHWSVLLAAASVVFVLAMALGRDSFRTVWGDESTYLAMAESLAEDGDLRFTEADRDRLAAKYAGDGDSPSRGTVILHRTDDGVAYSKPVLYALLAAPTVLLAGDLGPILLNLALLLGALWLGWLFLRRLGTDAAAGLTLVTFVGASVLLAHVGWRMTDLLQAALSLAGLVLTLTCLRRAADAEPGWLDGRAPAWLGGVLFGLLVALRLPNLLIVVAGLAALVISGRARRAGRVVLAGLASFLLMALLSQALIGTGSPYRAVRSSFDATSGYPTGEGGTAAERFESHPTTQRIGVVPDFRPRFSAYAALYFWVGRHSGLLWYFPAVLALLAVALRRPDPVTVTLLLGAAGAAVFYLIWWPQNYFGGSAFLGNRYFLAIYPLLLVALPRLPGRTALAGAWVVAALAGVSGLVSLGGSPSPAVSQSHARVGLFAYLPYESTAQNIDGRRDRYWARDLVRFVDSAPAVSEDSFVLDASSGPAELMVVTRDPDSAIVLRYRTRGQGLELVVTQRGETQRLPLDGGGHVRHGSLVVPLASSWRRHSFWWDAETTYAARTLRLSVGGGAEHPTDAERRVRFWYGGDPAMLDRSFDYRTHQVDLPESATAGTISTLPIKLRNMSPVPWTAEGAYPVSLGYQLLADEGDGSLIEGPRVSLRKDLPSGDPVLFELPVTWPEEPGLYSLRIDLLIEDYAWFATQVGEPVAQALVTVEAAAE